MGKLTAVFTKQQFLASRQRSGIDRDILTAVLDDDKLYSIAEVVQLMDDFLKKEAE
ncbi:hypothetical protein [Paenibacillus hemerocallicola]|uniref:hypothetical protein n=1 Tax=Paenibacillus hemerocallicola TaxID=1172614 RepID=UPI00159EE238|nr:hypothetical protein [Paenibacillus hemerocallicola]